MSNIGNLGQQIASLQLGHDGSSNQAFRTGKKVGPAVPPKPKKSQPQVGKFNRRRLYCMDSSNS